MVNTFWFMIIETGETLSIGKTMVGPGNDRDCLKTYTNLSRFSCYIYNRACLNRMIDSCQS
jgi:hypothetical protein